MTPIDLATRATAPEIRVGEEPRDAVAERERHAALRCQSRRRLGQRRRHRRRTHDRNVKVGSSPGGIALTHDGKTLWVANGDDGTIESIETAR